MCKPEGTATLIARLDAVLDRLEAEAESAEKDRIQISRLILLVQRLTEQGATTMESAEWLKQTAVHVAADLAASIVRADEAPAETPGAGADAALRSGETAAEAAHHGP